MEGRITIRVNGADQELDAGTSVAGLIAELQLRPELVAVEVNRELVARAEREARELIAGDVVELVTLVGGG